MGYEFGLGRRIYGVVNGVVTDNKHPEGMYRVKVKFEWIQSTKAQDKADYISSWARVASPMAGAGRGFYCLPEPEDEVIVSFVHGDIRYPVVLGALWNEKDKMPVNDKAPKASTDPKGNDLGIDKTCKDNNKLSGKNTSRFWNSRNGNTILFDDTDGKEKVSIFTKKGHMLNLNDEKDVISFYDAGKKTYIHLDAKNETIYMFSNKDIKIEAKALFEVKADKIVTEAKSTVSHKAGSTWEQKSGGVMTIKAGGDINMNAGPNINLNC